MCSIKSSHFAGQKFHNINYKIILTKLYLNLFFTFKMADLEAHFLDEDRDFVFDEYFNEEHHQRKDYKKTYDRIDDNFAFYNTQYNYI